MGVKRGPGIIPEAIRDQLTLSAFNLYANRQVSSFSFQEDECQGKVTTEWDVKTCGTISGILFTGLVENDVGDYEIRFLINPKVLNKGHDALASDGFWGSTGDITQDMLRVAGLI